MFKLHKIPETPLIHFSKQNEIVDKLLEIIDIHELNANLLKTENERLKEKIAELEKAPKKPEIKPSSIEKPASSKKPVYREQKKPKIDRLPVHQQVTIKPENIPDRSAFKDYRKYFIQDIELKRHNTLFRLERWKTAEGKYLKACLPKEYQGFHFGPNLRVFILQQYYQARVTQSKLLEQLTSWNIEISEGELNHIISSYTPEIEKELNAMLGIALKESNYIQTDDTGARHKGKNQVCLQVGNKLFTYLTTGVSKSRLRFLELLNQSKQYLFNQASVDYLRQQGSLKLIEVAKKQKSNLIKSNLALFFLPTKI